MNRKLILPVLMLLLVACTRQSQAYTEEQLDLALTELSATRTQEVSQAAATQTPAPETSSTPDPEPTPTVLPDPEAPHEDGVYIVGAEMAVGVWRSTAEGQRFCYWARRKYDGILLASYYGLPGIDLRIYNTDYEVELDGCGTWIYMGR